MERGGASTPAGPARETKRPIASLAELSPGAVLDDKYRLVERIGRGGFGDVWRAVELLPGGAPLRDVALKVLAPEFDGTTWAEEAKLLASLSHDSLVTIYQAGILQDIGAPFVAMELLIGETLADKLRRRGKLPWRAALRYGRDVAAALDAIHARGVVHLDLKPANLFVTQGGEVKVLDFGISRSAHGAIPRHRAAASAPDPALLATVALADTSDPYALTQIASGGDVATGGGRVVYGTPGFVAPEVLASSEPTRLADAYALGVTLAQLVTGGLPYDVSVEPPDDSDGETLRAYFIELREATLAGKMTDLEDRGLPSGFALLVRKLCAVSPAERDVASLFGLVDEAWTRPHGVGENPYPGARAYGPEREGLLFGRDAERERLLRHLAFEGALVVAGAFGSGKTSFVRASLVPELAKRGLDGRIDLRVGYASLEVDPDAALDGALGAVGAQPFEGEEDDGDFARLAGLSVGDDVGTVIVIDDLEQLLGCGAESRRRLVRFIGDGLGGRVEGLRIILIADIDSVDRLAEVDPALAGLPGVVRYLAPPPEAAAKEISAGPAHAAGWSVASAEALTHVVQIELARGGTLASIAIALAAWARPAACLLDPSQPLPAALHRHATEVFARLSPGERERATEILLQLCTSEGEPVTRTVEDVVRLAGDDDTTRSALASLHDAYLVIVVRDAVRLGHPTLGSFPLLASARLGAMDRLALRERLAEVADAWERSNRHPDYLDRGDLRAALRRHGPAALRGLRAIEHELLAASQSARRRSLAWRAVVGVGLLVGLVLLLVGKRTLDQRRAAAEEAEREAKQKAEVTELVARARGAADPYQRVAYLAESMRRGAADPALPMELLAASFELAPARFLTLDPVDRPAMPWGSRWVIGIGAAGTLTVIDLEPVASEPEVLEHVDVDVDAKRLDLLYRRPVVRSIAVGGAPVVDVVPFAFDEAVLARNALGEVHVFRLRASGEIALAAVLPMYCRGGLAAAARAPVVACIEDDGISVWDARKRGAAHIPEPAGALAVSPDGTRVAAWTGADVVLLRPFDDNKNRTVIHAPGDVRVAAFGPREPLIALGLGGRLIVTSPDAPEPFLVDVPALADPADIRWDEGGLDVTLCKLSGQPVHYYLRRGARPASEPKPSGRCNRLSPSAPRLVSRFSLGDFAARSTGTHFAKAFELDRGRVLSTSLVLALADDDRLDRELLFAPRDEEWRPLDAPGVGSIAAVLRADDVAAVERTHHTDDLLRHEPPEIVVTQAASGKRVRSLRGRLLETCPDGRILAWRVEGGAWSVFDVRTGGLVGHVRRAPGFVLGLGASCKKLYTQTLAGAVEVAALDGEPESAPKQIAELGGFVFDTEPTRGGLLLSLSSGEIARVDDKDDSVTIVARAAPRATALAVGAGPGEVLYADGLGLFRVGPGGEVDKIVAAPPGAPWEDVLPIRGGNTIVVASADELSVVDVSTRAVVGTAPIRGRTKLLPWGDSGSVLAYAPDVDGLPYGIVVPYGTDSVSAIASLASNLRVSTSGPLELKR